jgi:hypothetical protein
MVYKRTVLTKYLSTGIKAEFAVVMENGAYHAGLYVSGHYINGPNLPQLLTSPKDDITHWMGNKPSVGLTSEEAAKIVHEVDMENSVLEHRKGIRNEPEK